MWNVRPTIFGFYFIETKSRTNAKLNRIFATNHKFGTSNWTVSSVVNWILFWSSVKITKFWCRKKYPLKYRLKYRWKKKEKKPLKDQITRYYFGYLISIGNWNNVSISELLLLRCRKKYWFHFRSDLTIG